MKIQRKNARNFFFPRFCKYFAESGIIVTHEMGFAREVGTRLLFVDGGFIVEQGKPREVFENPKEERTKLFLSKIL